MCFECLQRELQHPDVKQLMSFANMELVHCSQVSVPLWNDLSSPPSQHNLDLVMGQHILAIKSFASTGCPHHFPGASCFSIAFNHLSIPLKRILIFERKDALGSLKQPNNCIKPPNWSSHRLEENWGTGSFTWALHLLISMYVLNVLCWWQCWPWTTGLHQHSCSEVVLEGTNFTTSLNLKEGASD